MRRPIALSRLTIVVGPLLGVLPRNSWIEVTDDRVDAHMGPTCAAVIPRATVVAARRRDWPWWAGLGGKIYGRMAVGFVGTFLGVVELELSEPVSIRALFPKRCTRFALLVDDPDALVTELQQPVVPTEQDVPL